MSSGFNLILQPVELALHVVGGADVAVGLAAEVEFHRIVEAPLERHLIDGQRRLAVVHRGMEVIRRIEMRAVVRRDRNVLDRRARAIGKLIDRHAEHLMEILRARLVIDVVDLRQHVGRIGRDARLQGDRNVDDAAGHVSS